MTSSAPHGPEPLPAAPTRRRRWRSRAVAAARDWLPAGHGLSPAVWSERHRWVVGILFVQAVALGVLSFASGSGAAHVLALCGIPVTLGLLACWPAVTVPLRSAAAAVGLMVESAGVVDVSGGAIEAHFHFFVMVPVVALYQSWFPFGLAVGFVLFHHGVVGTLDSENVYNHPSARAHPWRWAAVHAGFFAAECLGALVSWKLHERGAAVQRRLAASLAWRGSHDELTGLANRTGLRSRAEELLRSRRPVAMLVVELSRHEALTATLGPAWGDVVLRAVGPRLAPVLGPGDALARLEAATFAVVMADTDLDEAHEAADRIAAVLCEGFVVDGIDVDVEPRVGVAVGGTTVPGPSAASPVAIGFEDLLRRADVAVRQARTQRLPTAEYRSDVDDQARTRLTLLSDLRRALDAADQVVVHFQPKVELRSGATVGFEALVRWQHPEHGLLAPGAFLDAVEATALMEPLTDRVIDLALAEARHWKDAGHPLPVAVNVSPRCLLDSELPRRVARKLAEHGLTGAYLRIEITESTLMTDPAKALATLGALAAQGIGLSVDDFGTGYASMAYLSDLPVDELKVDRSFVAGLSSLTTADDPDPRLARRQAGLTAIVTSTIGLGHDLSLTVVAEGVEDDTTRAKLAAMGCDIAQGFGIARPMPREAVLDWLAGSHRRTPQAPGATVAG